MRPAIWMPIAARENGIKEVLGAGAHEKRILEYHKATSLGASDDETPWCSSFVNWVMKQAGIPGTDSAMARSWTKWGSNLVVPQYGAVCVLWRGTKTAKTGHVGFYLEHKGKDQVVLFGGNQGNRVCAAAYPADRVLCYRWAV